MIQQKRPLLAMICSGCSGKLRITFVGCHPATQSACFWCSAIVGIPKIFEAVQLRTLLCRICLFRQHTYLHHRCGVRPSSQPECVNALAICLNAPDFVCSRRLCACGQDMTAGMQLCKSMPAVTIFTLGCSSGSLRLRSSRAAKRQDLTADKRLPNKVQHSAWCKPKL